MGKQKARALFNPSILCFFDREEECRPTKPYTIDLYFPTLLYLNRSISQNISYFCIRGMQKPRGVWTSRCRLCVFIPYYSLIEL